MMSWVRMPSVSSRVHLRPADTANHGVVVDAALRVRLGVEEHLRVDHVLGMRLGQISRREIVEVLFRHQDAHALVVHPEERRQIVEIVGCPHLVDRPVRQLDGIAPAQLELHLRLQRPLHVDVQLGLRHALDEASHVRHDFKPVVRCRIVDLSDT